MYGEKTIKARIVFKKVVSVDFEVNYFYNPLDVELFDFYKIFRMEKKMIERIFHFR